MPRIKSYITHISKSLIMRKKVFVLLLLIPMISSSFSTNLLFADSASDAAQFNSQGFEQMKLGNFEEAISYFDKALEIEPDNVTYLDNKGLAVLNQLNYYEAFLIFEKVLKINPDDPIALASYYFTQQKMYKVMDSVVDITIRDSNGYLVGYFRTKQVGILLGDIAKKELDNYILTEMKYKGIDIQVLYFITEEVSKRETTISKTSMAPIGMDIPVVVSKHLGYPIEKGDVITAHYRIIRPIE